MSCNTASFEIRVVWTSTLEGYVNGLRFYINNTVIQFRSGFKSGKKKATERLNQFRRAIEATPEYNDAKRECKAEDLIVHPIAKTSFEVLNPLNGNLYNVVKSEGKLNCNCPDHYYRQSHCKHIIAVERHLEQSQQPILLSSFAGRAIRMGGRSSGVRAVTASSVELTAAEAKASIGL